MSMERLTTDNPQGNFETMLNYVYSKDGIAYIRSDGAADDLPLHEWAKCECIARGCGKSLGETMEEIDEAICDCALDYPECPIFLAYTFACQAVHLRDRLKRYEDTEQEGRLLVLPPNVPLTLEQLREMPGEPVWCKELECWGIVKCEGHGHWAGTPFLVGAWYDSYNKMAVDFEHDIKRRKYTLYRRKPEEGE